MEFGSLTGAAHPSSGTAIRAQYTDKHLYLRYDAPFSQLTTFEPPRLDSERAGLWDRDVVEAFIGPELENQKRYLEFEVAPTNEKLDLVIAPEIPELADRLKWNSGFKSWVKADKKNKVWTTMMRIPLAALSSAPVQDGVRWRINFYRIDRANQAFLAWNPTLVRTFHAPERFGWLEFRE